MKIINIKGSPMAKPSFPYISTLWHNSLGGIYCHSAELLFKEERKVPNKLALVNITLNIVSSLKTNPPKTYNKPVSRFLSYYREGDVIRIPLHMHETVEALVCNEWTKKKNGENNRQIAFPLKIEWTFGNTNYSFDFNGPEKETPGILCEPLTKDLKKDEKEEIIICLTRNDEIPMSLFDLS